MILHRRIHRVKNESFEEGIRVAQQLNAIAVARLGKCANLYQPSMLGSSLSRRHIVVDTLHESLAAMEQYFKNFLCLDEIQPLLARWKEIEEESWAENYLIIE
jgi:hypothetical protein